ncbi:MAG: ABC transporter permease [Clostridia bacterium]|nr:ABC transporter permease [Clostridia bacterium]
MQNEKMPKKIAWIRRRGAKRVVIGAVMASIIILLVLTSFFYTPYDPNATDLKARMVGPSAKHLFGTDQLGRDILSRVMSGGRVSLSIATMALLGTTVLGVVTGMLAGYYEGASDAVFNMIAEIRQSMPMMLIMIVFLAVFGSSILTMGIILALAEWVTIFRTVRAKTIQEKKMDYVQAAVANGASNTRIIFKYIFPNVLPSVIVLAALMIGSVILSEASLSYLGIGVTRPYPAWGRMISDGQGYFASGKWWVSTFPALAIAMLVLGVNVMADGLRQMWKME